jgi:hypothetical protein
LSEESDDEIHQKAAEPAYATARHYQKSIAISNNSTSPDKHSLLEENPPGPSLSNTRKPYSQVPPKPIEI